MILEMLQSLEEVYQNKMGGQYRYHVYKHCDALHEGERSKKALMSLNKCSWFPLFTFSK